MPQAVIRSESTGTTRAESLVAEIARAVASSSPADTAVQLANLWFSLSNLPEGQRIAWQADLANRLTTMGVALLQQTLDDRATRLRLVLIGENFSTADIAHALTLRGDIAALAGCARAALGAELAADVADCDHELASIASSPKSRRGYQRAVHALRARTRRTLEIEALGLGHLVPKR